MQIDFAKLSNEEIDAMIATQVMRYKYGITPHYWIGKTVSDLHPVASWRPSADHNDAALVRAEIERCGLQRVFQAELAAIVGRDNSDGLYTWRILNATCRQQCEAALQTMEDAS